MKTVTPYPIKTISEFHRLCGLSRPAHPLISVIKLDDMKQLPKEVAVSWMLDFYTISLKQTDVNTFKYGQQHYDTQDGVMYFMAPGQVHGSLATSEKELTMSGWGLNIHPDFFWNTPLAKKIRNYTYFGYSVHEALRLSEEEEVTIIRIMQTIQTEYFANTDQFSQDIISSMIEVLLTYADRFYHRQFLTRKLENHQLLDRLDDLLTTYFNDTDLVSRGLPSVQFIAEKLAISPNYLSSLLKVLTGRNTQQHIQDRMIEQAKERIAATHLSVSEISYALGFEHPQSFSRLFKAKTGLSPSAFRHTFN